MEFLRRRQRAVTPLDYGDCRDSIRNGDIVLFRGRSWLSRAIRWVTNSPYSHAGVAAWWGDRLLVLEAVGKGIVATRLSHVVHHYDGLCELWTTDAALGRDDVVRAGQLLLGRAYSKAKALALLKRILLRSRMRDPDPVIAPEAFVCSEFVSRVWRAGGIDLKIDTPDRFTKPGDIARSASVRKVGDLFRPSGTALVAETVLPAAAPPAQVGS